MLFFHIHCVPFKVICDAQIRLAKYRNIHIQKQSFNSEQISVTDSPHLRPFNVVAGCPA